MNGITGLIILLSTQGHWFGGQPGTVSIQWAAKVQLPAAVLQWEARIGGVVLSKGEVALETAHEPSVLTLTPPAVRARTPLRWTYRVRERATSRELGNGEAVIQVYPNDLLAGLDRQLSGKKLLVVDAADGLPRFLEQAHVKRGVVGHVSELQFARADIIVVGPDRLEEGPFAQAPLIAQAESGVSVAVLTQTKVARLAGYGVARRPAPSHMTWRMEHPLLTRLRIADVESWTKPGQDVLAIQLPADEPALEIGYWPREAPGEQPAPVDTVLVSKTTGAGRLVLCQIPLGPWEKDPRAQIFLVNLLSYLTTRPEPTPPPSLRSMPVAVAPASMPTITIPPGGDP